MAFENGKTGMISAENEVHIFFLFLLLLARSIHEAYVLAESQIICLSSPQMSMIGIFIMLSVKHPFVC